MNNTSFEGMLKPGAYDDLAVMICKEAEAEVVLLGIIGGIKGHGMSLACINKEFRMKMPSLLRRMAELIEQEQKNAEKQ